MRSQGGTFPVSKERKCSYPSAPHKRCRSILCVSACPRVRVCVSSLGAYQGWRGEEARAQDRRGGVTRVAKVTCHSRTPPKRCVRYDYKIDHE